MVEQKVLEEFVQGLKPEPKDTNTVHTAIVSNIDDEGVVWVNINGSDKETPTELVATEVKRGDAVTVQWRNNKLYVASNYTNPSAGVVRVSAVEAAALKKGETVIDAYCGTGTLGMICAKQGAEVVGVELNRSACRDADQEDQHNAVVGRMLQINALQDRTQTNC